MEKAGKAGEVLSNDAPPTADPRRPGRSIGTLLVEEGLIQPEEADRIRSYAVSKGLRFGEAAVAMKLVRPSDVEHAIARQFNYPRLPLDGYGAVHRAVVAAHDPTSDVVEPLRALRSQLTYRWHRHSKRNVLTIVSPGRGEGRSWLAANLSTVFAQAGLSTLLIDADLRNPRQHEFFRLQGSGGLSALLTGRAGAEAAQRINPMLPLYVLSAGSMPPNPQELLAQPAFSMVLERCSENFKVIIVDTPAASLTADAQVLAAQSGSALVLARSNHTRRAALNQTVDCLVQTGVDVVGSVFNDY